MRRGELGGHEGEDRPHPNAPLYSASTRNLTWGNRTYTRRLSTCGADVVREVGRARRAARHVDRLGEGGGAEGGRTATTHGTRAADARRTNRARASSTPSADNSSCYAREPVWSAPTSAPVQATQRRPSPPSSKAATSHHPGHRPSRPTPGRRRRVARPEGRGMNTADTSATTPELAWFKSSYSGGECVEVTAGARAVHVRDSKAADGPVLTPSPSAWAGFVELASSARTS